MTIQRTGSTALTMAQLAQYRANIAQSVIFRAVIGRQIHHGSQTIH